MTTTYSTANWTDPNNPPAVTTNNNLVQEQFPNRYYLICDSFKRADFATDLSNFDNTILPNPQGINSNANSGAYFVPVQLADYQYYSTSMNMMNLAGVSYNPQTNSFSGSSSYIPKVIAGSPVITINQDSKGNYSYSPNLIPSTSSGSNSGSSTNNPSTPTPPTAANPETNSKNNVVQFDFNDFITGFPNFNNKITELQAEIAFQIATTILDNSPCSAVPDINKRKLMLYVLTVHILTLELQNNIKYGTPDSSGSQIISGGVVGRVVRAERGEVDVELSDLNDISSREQWYVQTQFGFTYLQMAKPYLHVQFYFAPVNNFRPGL